MNDRGRIDNLYLVLNDVGSGGGVYGYGGYSAYGYTGNYGYSDADSEYFDETNTQNKWIWCIQNLMLLQR